MLLNSCKSIFRLFLFSSRGIPCSSEGDLSVEDVIKINEDFHLRQSKSKRPSNRTEQSDTQTDTLTESDPLPPGTQSMKSSLLRSLVWLTLE